MRVFVIGGTGFLGRHLTLELQKQGHQVSILTRDREKAADFERIGTKVVIGDLLQPESFVSTVSPHDAVMFVAMPEIRPGKVSLKRFKILSNQTVSYFCTSIAIAEKLSCPLILTLGTSFHTIGDIVANESWPIERFGMTKIGELVDPVISDVIKRGSPPLIQMLPGQIYGPGGLFRNFMYAWMKKGRYRVIGSGKTIFLEFMLKIVFKPMWRC